MKFDLRINPDWKVIDAKTGLTLTFVRWVDDQTHDVAWCMCARECTKNPFGASLMQAFGSTPQEAWQHCSDDEFQQKMPKVKIDNVRKTVLVNVDDTVTDQGDSDHHGEPRVRHALLLIAA